MTPARTPQPSLFSGLDPVLLDRYLAGVCTMAESAEIDRWVAGDQARRAALTGFRRGLAIPIEYPAFVSAPELANRVTTAAATSPHSARTSQAPHVHLPAQRRPWLKGVNFSRTRWSTAFGMGLGALLMTIGGYALLRSGVVHVNGARSTAMLTYVTRNGQRAEITLPDGSNVILNVASRLDVPANFMTGNHALRLQGEALFSAAHNTGAPLTVTAGAVTARVLGTSFVVRHYPTDTTSIVAVRDGRVAVQSIVASAQQQVITNSRGVAYMTPATSGQFTFATGLLTLDRVPLSNAIMELNRWYDADIRVADSTFLQARIRATFPTGSLSDLSAMLEFMLGARVVRDGRVLTVYHR